MVAGGRVLLWLPNILARRRDGGAPRLAHPGQPQDRRFEGSRSDIIDCHSPITPGAVMPPVCVSIDLEMTSARPDTQEVIEIAAIKFRDDRVLDTWTTFVRPRSPLPYGTQVLTGIDPATLERAP